MLNTNKYINKFKKWFSICKEEKSQQLPYVPLSPTDSAEDCDVYLDALTWALANKKRIKNIAISGPYGSGKSSILQTFIKKEEKSHKNRRWLSKRDHFLNISLATFEVPDTNNKENGNGKNQDRNSDIQRLIELSLLQQLFYRETNSKTPDSRLTKIHRLKSWMLFLQSIGVLVFAISVMVLFLPDKLDSFLKVDSFSFSYPLIKYSALIIFLLILFVIIYRSSRSIISLSIKKLNLQGTEIEIDKNISKSILNNHIDEIIYFFEATNYNVVVIEDLDRFGESEVFTKLREINLLINNSKKITRDIVFIYAIKDDMFQDKDRAKFFDFMIPIIPIVNYSNSGDKLKKMLEGSSTKIDDELIDDLSLFIDDMRLLYNIMNEFNVYVTKVSSQLDVNKLLAIIVYKNLYPKDFANLSENKGELYDTIIGKSQYIAKAISNINNQIESLKERLRNSEAYFTSNIKDLRTLYVSKICESILQNKVMGLRDGDKTVSMEYFTDDDTFLKIKDGVIEYYYNQYNQRYSNTYSYNFNEIEKQVNPELTYEQREKMIFDRRSINRKNIQNRLLSLNAEINRIKKSKLKDLLSENHIQVSCKDNEKKELIDILLRNGYINENYIDYISIFHEGALSKTDYQFLINVKRELKPQFDYVLNKKEELLKRISLYMFEKECILNFDVVDALLEYHVEDKTDALFKQLANEHELTINFINEYIDRSREQEAFTKKLCSYWQNIWKYIFSESSFTDERKEQYFLLILKYADIKDLEKIFDENDSYIANYRDFFIIDMDNMIRRELVEYLGINFRTINPNSPREDLQFLMDNYLYEINCEMLKVIIPKEKFDKEDFRTKNYSYLIHSDLDAIVDYIEEEINTYVEKILIGIEDNTKEDIEAYTLLLNNSKLELRLKEKLIEKIDTIIDDIATIDGSNETHLLFKYSKVKQTWENIESIFNKDNNLLTVDVITYLNNNKNAFELSNRKMPSDLIVDGVKKFSKLCEAIIHAKEISDESYNLLLKSIPWWYHSFDASYISTERMKVLIQNKMVSPTIDSYNYLLQNYKGLNILLLEIYPNKFISELDKLALDLPDMEMILKSTKLDNEIKFKLINQVDDSIIMDSSVNSKFVLNKVLLDSCKYSIGETLKLKLINKKELPVDERITLFLKINDCLDNEKIISFLLSLGFPYNEIPNPKKSPTINRNDLNEKLMNILIQKGVILSYSDKNNKVYHSKSDKNI